MRFFNYFDRIYVNHLPYRKDRYIATKTWLDAFNVQPQWHKAIFGLHEIDNILENPKPILDQFKPYLDVKFKFAREKFKGVDQVGFFGCSLSNALIVLDALKNGYEKVLIFEDDAQPTPAFLEYADSIIDEIEKTDWDFISFGKPHKHWDKGTFEILPDHNHMSKHVKKTAGLLHAYAIHKNAYEHYIKICFAAFNKPLDFAFSDTAHKVGLTYHATYPCTFVQSTNFSDIQQRCIKKEGSTTNKLPMVYEQFRRYSVDAPNS